MPASPTVPIDLAPAPPNAVPLNVADETALMASAAPAWALIALPAPVDGWRPN